MRGIKHRRPEAKAFGLGSRRGLKGEGSRRRPPLRAAPARLCLPAVTGQPCTNTLCLQSDVATPTRCRLCIVTRFAGEDAGPVWPSVLSASPSCCPPYSLGAPGGGPSRLRGCALGGARPWGRVGRTGAKGGLSCKGGVDTSQAMWTEAGDHSVS